MFFTVLDFFYMMRVCVYMCVSYNKCVCPRARTAYMLHTHTCGLQSHSARVLLCVVLFLFNNFSSPSILLLLLLYVVLFVLPSFVHNNRN